MMKRSIYISYSHKDKRWKERLLSHLKTQQIQADQLSIWDEGRVKAGSAWQELLEKDLHEAGAAILLVSASYLISDFVLKIEIPRLLDRRAEQGLMIFPFIVEPCAWETVDWLKKLRVYPKNGKALSAGTKYEISDGLASFAANVAAFIKRKDEPKSEAPSFPLAPRKISLFKLPATGEKFFGREDELKELDAAWADEHIHIVTLIAWSGVGKSALVNRWLNIMERKNYGGAGKVYGWSFYSQGAEEGKQASADEFMQETLTWFGDKNSGEGSAVEKGRRLARLVQKEKTLLVLDGIEPLQFPPGEVHGFDGKLKDRGLKTFLKELSGGHPGLCIITSREPVTDLAHNKGFTLKEMELEHLSTGAGMQLLKSLGVKGTEKEVEKAVSEYKGHALALTLLGQYIKSVYEGDIRKRDTIPRLTKERTQGRHARRVMEAYERWLGESSEHNILRIMGLFDRPVERGAIDSLKADPAIPGVTDKLQKLSEEDWLLALDNLRAVNLLAPKAPQRPDRLDCHPLVRVHFGEKLRIENPEGWKSAHKRLYQYYKGLPEKEFPDTLAEMEPLFAAVTHGCSAGLYIEAEREVYWKRISRGNDGFIFKKLGAFGTFLAVIANFFEKPWTHPAPGLTNADKAVVLSWAAFGLRAVGRLHEAIQPVKAALEAHINQENWKESALDAGNLSELMLTLGNVAEAVTVARESVTHADHSGDDFLKEAFRTVLADALHQSGNLKEAEQWFREAEAMQKKRQPLYSFLYSLQGYRYCDLLLGQGKYSDVMERAGKFFEWILPSDSLLDVSLANLTAGRAWLMKTITEDSRNFTRALEYVNRAVTGLREAGAQHHLTRGILARAGCFRSMDQFSNAWDDLKEAEGIAEPGSMKLFLCDYHLEAGRLCAAEGKEKEAQQHFQVAKEMIEETGYFRRKNEVVKK
jgi:tetratricopeptide (TPR) repeat protein